MLVGRTRSSEPKGQEHGATQPPRLYRRIADGLLEELRAGRYPVGARMPAERELAERLGVSRPVIREAMLALEVLGYVEVRLGSGAYVIRIPGEDADEGTEGAPDISPLDLTHARLMIDGEAAALAAHNITDEQIAQMEAHLEEMARDDSTFDEWNAALTAFHRTMAIATGNAVMQRAVTELWEMRQRSPECRRLLEKAKARNFRPSVDQHAELLAAFKAHDSLRARAAMRMHLEGSINHLLLALEERAVADARARVEEIRARYMDDRLG